jgi:ribosomal protein S18 acetylase RimI-like enzyme
MKLIKLKTEFNFEDVTPLIEINSKPTIEFSSSKKRFSSQILLENPSNYLEEIIRNGNKRHIVNCALANSNGDLMGVAMVERSSWDTDLFGVGIGKLKLALFANNVDLESRRCLFSSIKEQAASAGLSLVFARVPLNDQLTIHSLEANGAIITDVLVTLARNVTSSIKNEVLDSDIIVEEASVLDEEALLSVANNTFTLDHFHGDSRLPRDKCQELFSKWTSNSLKGLANVVFAAKRAGEVLGFVTCKLEESHDGVRKGAIDLLGVKIDCKGIGIGTLLVSRALEWFSDRVDIVLVGTQAANTPAIRLYSKMGFKKIFSEATLHLWTS